jgi:hypothetical protein
MNPILESSVLARTLRWLARESYVASGVKAVLRVFGRVDEAFARAAADKESRAEPERVTSILRDSAIVRAVDTALSAPFAAWEHARVRPFVDDVRATVAAMPVPHRIRLLGWMLAVALATRAALYVLSGAPVTAATLLVWSGVLAVALVMMTVCRQIAVAWDEWQQRKR